ncbi:unnamed protein product [Adineta ricciae]|uniref:Uncharacterized protein n=1 Tax=Adineta ricciae TaxID=249248 RepID=A0A815L7T1_ADIRI|nr:unnamed protein product [Adineta ricciae]
MEQHKYTIMILIFGLVSIGFAELLPESMYPLHIILTIFSYIKANHAASQGVVRLINVHEFAFNGGKPAVQLAIPFSTRNKDNYAVFVNGQSMMNTSHTTNFVVLTEESDAISILTLFTLHTNGLPIVSSFHLYFRDMTTSIRVSYSNGSAATNVTVNLNLMENPHVGQMHSTNHHGIVVFQNIPSLSTLMSARTKQHYATLVGIIPSASQINIILMLAHSMTMQNWSKYTHYHVISVTRIAEAIHRIPCGIDSYALSYGMRYCTKFSHSLKTFTPQGQRWIWKTMNCLQKSLVSPLENCANNCSALRKIAFASHSTCYVKSGVCELSAFDWVRIVSIVGKDLFTSNGFIQALSTFSQCTPDLLERISLLILEDSLPLPVKAALIDIETWVRLLQKHILRLY